MPFDKKAHMLHGVSAFHKIRQVLDDTKKLTCHRVQSCLSGPKPQALALGEWRHGLLVSGDEMHCQRYFPVHRKVQSISVECSAHSDGALFIFLPQEQDTMVVAAKCACSAGIPSLGMLSFCLGCLKIPN